MTDSVIEEEGLRKCLAEVIMETLEVDEVLKVQTITNYFQIMVSVAEVIQICLGFKQSQKPV